MAVVGDEVVVCIPETAVPCAGIRVGWGFCAAVGCLWNWSGQFDEPVNGVAVKGNEFFFASYVPETTGCREICAASGAGWERQGNPISRAEWWWWVMRS